MTTANILDPINDIEEDIHIIGCGAIGSNLAIMLTRLGASKITLWDDDIVSGHNITNQSYYESDRNLPKVEQLAKQLKAINNNLNLKINNCKYKNQRLSGYVFLCVDNIDTRKDIVITNKINRNIKAMFDFRMGLYDAQTYACKWKGEDINSFYDTMNFTHEEAKDILPVSPCGTSLSVLPTVMTVVSCGVSNFIKLVRDREYHKLIIVDTNLMNIVTI